MWRMENPSDRDDAEDIVALAEAIADFGLGDRGRPAGELSRELREELNLR